MMRGNAGQEIFLSDEESCRFLWLLQEAVERFRCRIHAFCLMSNHVHLAIQVSDIPLSRIMQNITFRYTRWFNRRHKRIGHLFQGRYKAILVDSDAYLLELVRYIHLNPIRAGIVHQVEQYGWSGHRAYLGLEVLPWLSVSEVLGRFSEEMKQARERYADFVGDGLDEGYRSDLHQGEEDSRLLGDHRFVEATMLQLQLAPEIAPGLDEIVSRVCDVNQITETELIAKGRTRYMAERRAIIGYLAVELSSCSISAVACRFHRDIATLSGAIRRVRLKANADEAFARMLSELKANIVAGSGSSMKSQ
ncbi:transposase [Mariprofundus erugo]|uniref:transposase n=1 Tax=Mariprofundus erugo TaxID=2528639 RepID=UPI00237A834D|nr:transposase [Mariprofundus erugo]